ncbi:LysE family translocator [uncultured Albimonas sp.]|uniref:LysE family translocator n=1 Tax=uncultured Albimonas sp. TaxID=1331701 RepID=UPI0030EE4CC2|tara:strand:+ start:3484 stop:4095 length:612 start_codon:yes stop_codon:yes gene_type:complete
MITLEFLLTALVVVAIPGTGAIYTLSCGLGRGRMAALAAVAGCTVAVLVHLAAALAGLAAVLHASAVLFQGVKIAGVAFLLWMAWATWREGGGLCAPTEVAERGLRRIAIRGVLINLLNPKLAIFFAAFLPQFVQPGPGATAQMGVLGLVFTGLTALVFAIYGLFAARARDWILASEAAMRWMRRAFAACFAGLGLRLALTER